MIYVTQGSHNGIGLEVFLKSFSLLTSLERKQITLLAHPKCLDTNYQQLRFLPFRDLNLLEMKSMSAAESFQTALDLIDRDLKVKALSSILVTLPARKDEIPGGHTHYFRRHFPSCDPLMCFSHESHHILLLTDHIPLREVAKTISQAMIIQKLTTCLSYLGVKKVVFAGINPHAGENGEIGHEDSVIHFAVENLKNQSRFSGIEFLGPISADALWTLRDRERETLFVFPYHDQGLTSFKAEFQFLGVHHTLGLPFRRLSVDHGTADQLYGLNRANYLGQYKILKLALQMNQDEDCENHSWTRSNWTRWALRSHAESRPELG